MEDSPFDSQDLVKAVAGVVIATAKGRVIQDDNDDDSASVTRSELSALCQRIDGLLTVWQSSGSLKLIKVTL